jgi:hypothetical protein
MKQRSSKQRNHALTLVDLLVVIAVLSIMVVIILPILARPRHHKSISCDNNLQQIGLSYRIWAGDNDSKFPFEVSVANGGTRELNIGRNAWLNYLVMSNELSTPKILVCPDDKKRQPPATNFSSQLAGHVSYLVGLDADPIKPNSILAADDHVVVNGVRIRSGILELSTNVSVQWTKERHQGYANAGNVLFSSGLVLSERSIQYPTPPFPGLQEALAQSGLATNHLAIP